MNLVFIFQIISDDKKKSKGCWYRFTQQQLPAWQPVLTPKCVVATFYVLAAIILPLGAVLLHASNSVTRFVFDYTDVDDPAKVKANNVKITMEEGKGTFGKAENMRARCEVDTRNLWASGCIFIVWNMMPFVTKLIVC